MKQEGRSQKLGAGEISEAESSSVAPEVGKRFVEKVEILGKGRMEIAMSAREAG